MGVSGIDVGELDFAEPKAEPNVWPGSLMGVSGIDVGELDFAEPKAEPNVHIVYIN